MGRGGAERRVSILLDKLHDKYDITLILMCDIIYFDIPPSVEVVFVEKSRIGESNIGKFLKLPILGWRYREILKQRNIDISLSFMTRPNYINILAKLFGSGVGTIISEVSMFSVYYGFKNMQSLINRKLVRLYNLADLIITNALGNNYDLRNSFNIQKEIVTIYNPLDLSEIEKRKEEPTEIKKKRFTFVTVGRLDAGKNHLLLIEAMRRLDADLWIIGYGDLREVLEARIKEYHLEDKVYLLGRQNNPYKFLNKADAFVFASNFEGLPNVLLEALACRLPIISTDCKSGPREILAPGSDLSKEAHDIEIAEYGVLVPVGDIERMQKAMQILMQDKSLIETLTKKVYSRAKDFEVNHIIDQWLEVLA